MRRGQFVLCLALLAAVLASCGPGGALDAFADVPGRIVKLPDGRGVNLRCSGRGSPTVILESGYGASGAGWGSVQPAISKVTRACAYDRAGYGLSDPGPLPRDGAAIARDLDNTLKAGGVEGPYVLVAHSAGGLYARLFAARRRGDVQGLVLLDPTVEAIAGPAQDGLGGMRRRRETCLALAQASPQPAHDDPRWRTCLPTRGSGQPEAAAYDPDIWRNQLSELDSIFGRTSEEVTRIGDLLQDVPIYVLTASETAAAAKQIGYDKPQSTWELEHIRLALSARRGGQRTVLSSHRIMADRPDVVVDAVLAMVRAARTGSPPEPLATSETQAPDEDAFPRDPPATK